MTGVLALDLATSTGFAYWQPGGDVVYGTHTMPNTGRDVGRFLLDFERWLTDLIARRDVEWLVFEAPWVGPKTAQATARKLVGLAGMTEYIARRDRITRCMEAPVRAVRYHFIGANLKRDLAKEETRRACQMRGWTPANDDEADALALLDYAAHTLKLKPTWPCGALFR